MDEADADKEFGGFSEYQLDFILYYYLAALYAPHQYEILRQQMKFIHSYEYDQFYQPKQIAKQLGLPRTYQIPINIYTSNFRRCFTDIVEIGAGGFGTVFRATSKSDGKVYAIKRLPMARGTAVQRTDQVLSEVRILSRLVNDFVVRYYDAWIEQDDGMSDINSSEESGIQEHQATFRSLNYITYEVYTQEYYGTVYESLEGSFNEETAAATLQSEETCASSAGEQRQVIYIQMEYCDGKSLFDYLRDGTLNEYERWKITIDLLLGLQFIHSQMVLHHDIKPENIFMTRDLSVKYGDFGIARSINDRKWYHGGTQLYMPPESSEKEKLDFSGLCKRDIYALGITLLQLWQVGVTRYQRPGDSSECLQWLAAGVPQRDLAEILLRMVEHDYKTRYSLQQVIRAPVIFYHVYNAEAFIVSYCSSFKQEPTNIDKLKEMVSLLLSQKQQCGTFQFDTAREYSYVEQTEALFGQEYTAWETILNYHESKEIQFLNQYLQERYIIHKDLYLLIDIRDLPVLFSLQNKMAYKCALYLAIFRQKQYPAQVFYLQDNLMDIFLDIKTTIVQHIHTSKFIQISVDNSKRKFKLESKQLSFSNLYPQLKSTYVWNGFEVLSFVVQSNGSVIAFGGIVQNYLQVIYLFE